MSAEGMQVEVDRAKADAFAGRLLAALNDGALVSLAQGGEGVGAMGGKEMTRDYLDRAGFWSIVTHRLAHDIQNNWLLVSKHGASGEAALRQD